MTDYTCPPGRSKKVIKISDGDNFSFTIPDKYVKNHKIVHYLSILFLLIVMDREQSVQLVTDLQGGHAKKLTSFATLLIFLTDLVFLLVEEETN